jgi:glyoxylase-like metal-dependent hydrolase (beta-lactamase superfamily II)
MAADETQGSIRRFVVGDISTNCYVIAYGTACLVVDPGASGAAIAEEVARSGLSVEGIVCTHGHHDHVGGVGALKRETGAPYMISAKDNARAQRACELSSHVFDLSDGSVEDAPAADRTLAEGDTISVGDVTLTVIEAPGHTEGGIVLMGPGFALVGDTIFAGSVGRTDLYGGDAATLAATIARLKELIPPETVLLCGHGPETTMARELATNPWFR